MPKVTNGKIELSFERQDKELLVTLSASQYHYQAIARFRPFLEGTDQLLEGEIQSVTDEELVLCYHIPEFTESLKEHLKSLDELERFSLARQYSSLLSYESKNSCIFLHPDNLFIASGQILVAHRGLSGVVAPESLSEAEFLTQYKALVVSTLQPKAQFEQLASGKIKTRDSFSKEIQSAEDVRAVEVLLDKQYQVMRQAKKVREVSVKKSRYKGFRIFTFLFALIALGLGIAFGYTQISSLPLQSRVISSQSDFINSNYNQVVTDLENDNPNNLPKSAQYVLAASYVHLDNLTNDQKQAVLNTLSQNSSGNELLYWVEIGRGNLNAALNIAQNIGDNQLILHTYTKLYDATNADTTMSGSKKQSLLNQYKSDINKYVKLIGGKTNG